jgi:hypothetical protein
MADVCTCGHALDEHGGDLKYPGSTACHGEGNDGEDCDCSAYEEDEDE